jgi:hypothetical protein
MKNITPENTAAGIAVLRFPARNDSSVALKSQTCTINKTAINDIAPEIAVRPRVCGGKSVGFAMALILHSGRKELLAP